MSDDDIRVAIAEFCGTLACPGCGWKQAECKLHDYKVPDYPNDLNAMRQAERWIEDKSEYCGHLWKLVVAGMPHIRTDSHLFAFTHATARQRAEAFLKTIGKWPHP